MTILFGTSGIPSECSGSTEEGVRVIKKIGLDAMEIEFVRSIYLTKSAASHLKKVSRESKVFLSCHAPYYINLASPDRKKLAASKHRILSSARVCWLAGARDVVFHCGYYMNFPKKKVFRLIYSAVKEISSTLSDEGIDVYLRPEVSGRVNVFGSLDEILSLCSIDRVLPCIDFSHLHARTGGSFTSLNKFENVLKKIEERVGKKALKNLHMHASGIEYGPTGEKNHTFLMESDFNYKLMLQALKSYNVSGTLICESPAPEKDALLLKRTYKRM